MSGIAAKSLSIPQITQILNLVAARLEIRLNCSPRIAPGQPLLASLVPATPDVDVSELVNGVLNLAWLEKEVLYQDLKGIAIPGSDTANGTADVDGDSLLARLETPQPQPPPPAPPIPDPVIKKPFPLPGLGAQPLPQTAGLAAQIAGTLSLPKLSVSVKIQWCLSNSHGIRLSDGTDFISSGLLAPSLSILIPPALTTELRRDTIVHPGGDILYLSAKVSLAVGTEPAVSVPLGPIPLLQLPVLVPTVVALFSEPNFGLTEDSSVVLLVPAHSPFASAAPLFKELQRIERVLDTLRSIAGIAGFLLGLSEITALIDAPRLRFIAADAVPRFSEITLKHKPWYNFFGDDPNFDDTANSLFVFGTPGTAVTFFNDIDFRTNTNQGFYQITLSNAIGDPASPLPDCFVSIPHFPTSAEVNLDNGLDDHTAPPPTSPPGRIGNNFKPDHQGDHQWDTDLSSMKFNSTWLSEVNRQIAQPTIIGDLPLLPIDQVCKPPHRRPPTHRNLQPTHGRPE